MRPFKTEKKALLPAERQLCEYCKKADSIKIIINEGQTHELRLALKNPADDIKTLSFRIALDIQDYFLKH